MIRSPLKIRIMGMLLVTFVAAISGTHAHGQTKLYERTFSQSPAAVQNALDRIEGAMSGHLPTLDGFAVSGERPLDRYQRAYFQATAKVSSTNSGQSTVHVSVKVTAWYDD